MKNEHNLNPVTLTAALVTGAGLRSFDLFSRAPLPTQVAIALRLLVNGTAPGSAKNLTCYYALAPSPDLTVAQLADAAGNQVFVLPNAASVTRDYTLQTINVGQRYLYLWFDHDALAGGCVLTVTPVLNT